MNRNLYLEARTIFNSRQFTSKERVDSTLDRYGAYPVKDFVKHDLSINIGRLVHETFPLTEDRYGDMIEYSIQGYFLTKQDVEAILRLLDEALQHSS